MMKCKKAWFKNNLNLWESVIVITGEFDELAKEFNKLLEIYRPEQFMEDGTPEGAFRYGYDNGTNVSYAIVISDEETVRWTDSEYADREIHSAYEELVLTDDSVPKWIWEDIKASTGEYKKVE